MKKLLFILPLLLWVGCEDDTETPFPFSDEFYNVVSSTWYYWDNDDWVLLKVETWEYDYNSPFTPITLTP